MDANEIPVLELNWGQLQTCCRAVGSANFTLKRLREGDKPTYLATFGALQESWYQIEADLDAYPAAFQNAYQSIDPDLQDLFGAANSMSRAEFAGPFGRIYRRVDTVLLGAISKADEEMLRGMVARALNDSAKP